MRRRDHSSGVGPAGAPVRPDSAAAGAHRASSSRPDDERIRRRLEIRGRIQGVGFRPFVYRLATELYLGGLVGNDAHGAFVEVEGWPSAVERFTRRMQSELPPLGRIMSLTCREMPVRNDPEFRIDTSRPAADQDAEITPDTATCGDCLRELLDPGDRRYRYPFINCTNCGPRYSIIQAVPYDRPNTTMAKFRMCPRCRREYDDPADRRFHAQPNACPACGPRLWAADPAGNEIDGDAIGLAAARLHEGQIVAVKGLGGFHLAVRADDDAAVARLRERKAREAKPLAVMVRSLEAARELVELDAAAAAALVDPTRPVVLAPKRRGAPISAEVAPGSDCHGVMLPYTPLHHLLLAAGPGPLVMTSGNPSEEPLCRDNDEALRRLGGIADLFVLHDRDIERRVDDSIVKAVRIPGGPGEPEPRIVPIRRARGLVPGAIAVPDRGVGPVLAVGAELKSAVCLLAGTTAVLSEHLGELSNPAAYRNFAGTIERFKELLRLEPEIVAYDLHPDYAATRYARGLPLRATAVQHHHAHVVSCMADCGISGRVVGVCCDGTGYGTDGAVWGCEVLLCDEADFERAGQLAYYPLPGGDAAALETWRPAAGLLHATFGRDWIAAGRFAFDRVKPDALAVADRRLNAAADRIPRTSSLGRLFDAAAFLLDLRERNRFEAEAAMAIEALAATRPHADPLEYAIADGDGGPMRMDFRPMVRDLVERIVAGRCPAELARAFHETVARMLADCADRAAAMAGLDRVVLSGGCFANRILLERVCELLQARGREVFVHDRVPTGDGGIALGQAVAAAERARKGEL